MASQQCKNHPEQRQHGNCLHFSPYTVSSTQGLGEVKEVLYQGATLNHSPSLHTLVKSVYIMNKIKADRMAQRFRVEKYLC